MRKYRAKQRSDPLRYQQYLARERYRNNKRKFDKRVQVAQEEAQALGLPYIVLDPSIRRGPKSKYGFDSSDVLLVLPAKFEDCNEDEHDLDEKPLMPVKHEKAEWDSVQQDRKPNISAVNINTLLGQQRSALQTLLPEEVNDRKFLSNNIKSENGYTKDEKESMYDDRSRTSRRQRNRDKKKLLQKQYRSYISNPPGGSSPLPNRTESHQSGKESAKSKYFVQPAEHEDFDDLFKELEEVAKKQLPRKKPPISLKKLSDRQLSPRRQSFFKRMQAQYQGGEYSLDVSMPVQCILESGEGVHIKDEPESPTNPADNTFSFLKNDYSPASNHKIVDDFSLESENSIEIKEEPHFDDYSF